LIKEDCLSVPGTRGPRSRRSERSRPSRGVCRGDLYEWDSAG